MTLLDAAILGLVEGITLPSGFEHWPPHLDFGPAGFGWSRNRAFNIVIQGAILAVLGLYRCGCWGWSKV